jgi:hypothetical protein
MVCFFFSISTQTNGFPTLVFDYNGAMQPKITKKSFEPGNQYKNSTELLKTQLGLSKLNRTYNSSNLTIQTIII